MPKNGEFEVVLFGGTHKVRALSRSTGIYVLATMLRDEGYTVQCVDYLVYIVERFTPEQQRELLSKFLSTRTFVVGISTTLLAHVEDELHYRWWGTEPQKMKAFFDIIRELAPNAKIVVGGSNVRQSEEEFIATFYRDWADYWVTGQGEMTFLALVNHIKYEDPLTKHVENGIVSIRDADYPFNDFSRSRIVWDKGTLVHQGETLPMEIARGCIFSCSFCSYQLIGKKWGEFTRSKQIIRDELIRNYETNGTTRYVLTDDTINDSLDKVKFLHEIFTSLPFKPEWAAYARLDLINKFPEMAQLLMESGLKATKFGIETLHHEAGKRVGKGLGPERIKATLKHCREVWGDRVHMTGLFIFGLPTEPLSSIHDTIAYLQSDECPLDNSQIQALQISSRGNSKMDMAPSKFGYTRMDERDWNRFEDWKTDELDAHTARILARDFEKKVHHGTVYQGLPGFVLMSVYGMVSEEYAKKTRLIVGLMEVDRQSKQRRTEYFENLLALDTGHIAPTGERVARHVEPKPSTLVKKSR